MARLPSYVPIVLDGKIRLEAVSGELAKAIRSQGLPLKHSWFLGWSIPFENQSGSDCDNPALISAMLVLAELGLKFGEDYKQALSPADFMRELQQRDLLRTSFDSISWAGPGQWQLQRHQP